MAYFDPDFLNHRFRRWDQLPDIELYMDQVIGFLEKELRPVLRETCARAEGDAAFAGEIALEAAARRLCVGELVAKSEEKLEGKE